MPTVVVMRPKEVYTLILKEKRCFFLGATASEKISNVVVNNFMLDFLPSSP